MFPRLRPLRMKKTCDAVQPPLLRQGDDVQVPPVAADILAFLDAPEGGDLVAQDRGALEVQGGGSGLHGRRQIIDDLTGAAIEELDGVVHVRGVVGRADQGDAGPAAALDLVLEAGARAGAKEAVLALAHRKQLLQELQGLAHRRGAGVGPEEAPRPLARPAVEGEPREDILGGQIDVRIALVVAQQDVVARLQGLDEVALQQQGLALGAGDRDLDVGDLSHHGLEAHVQRPGEIAPDPAAQVLGLAHVQDLALGILHPVDPRGRGDAAHGARRSLSAMAAVYPSRARARAKTA